MYPITAELSPVVGPSMVNEFHGKALFSDLNPSMQSGADRQIHLTTTVGITVGVPFHRAFSSHRIPALFGLPTHRIGCSDCNAPTATTPLSTDPGFKLGPERRPIELAGCSTSSRPKDPSSLRTFSAYPKFPKRYPLDPARPEYRGDRGLIAISSIPS